MGKEQWTACWKKEAVFLTVVVRHGDQKQCTNPDWALEGQKEEGDHGHNLFSSTDMLQTTHSALSTVLKGMFEHFFGGLVITLNVENLK